MKYDDAFALVEASLNSEPPPLSEADVAVIKKFNPDADMSELLDYYDAVYVTPGWRFILGLDGDAYLVDGKNAYYLPVENCCANPDEIASSPL